LVRISAARFDSTPITTRSGRMKVSIAAPSRRNSGFDATSNWAPRGRVGAQHLEQRARRAHRRRALLHHQLVVVEVLRHRFRHVEDGAGIGAPVATRRRAHGDEHHRRPRERFADVGGEGEPALGHVALHQLRQPRLEERDLQVLRAGDARGIAVDAHHLMAEVGEAGSGDETHVASAYQRDLVQARILSSRRLWRRGSHGRPRGVWTTSGAG
jgi:hypothetical protein